MTTTKEIELSKIQQSIQFIRQQYYRQEMGINNCPKYARKLEVQRVVSFMRKQWTVYETIEILECLQKNK